MAPARLEAEGWVRRFLADPARAHEAADTYRSVGFEVRLEPPNTDGLDPACVGCHEVLCRQLVVYTRLAREEKR